MPSAGTRCTTGTRWRRWMFTSRERAPGPTEIDRAVTEILRGALGPAHSAGAPALSPGRTSPSGKSMNARFRRISPSLLLLVAAEACASGAAPPAGSPKPSVAPSTRSVCGRARSRRPALERKRSKARRAPRKNYRRIFVRRRSTIRSWRTELSLLRLLDPRRTSQGGLHPGGAVRARTRASCRRRHTARSTARRPRESSV